MLLLKCSTQYVSKFGKLSRGHKTGKGQFLSQSQRTAKSKNLQTTAQICSFNAITIMGKILGFSIVRTENFQMSKLGLEKAEEPVIKLSTFIASWRSKGILGEKKNFCFIDYAKAFDWVNHNKLWKILKRWEYHTTLPVS